MTTTEATDEHGWEWIAPSGLQFLSHVLAQSAFVQEHTIQDHCSTSRNYVGVFLTKDVLGNHVRKECRVERSDPFPSVFIRG
jgi:hypothetical protein